MATMESTTPQTPAQGEALFWHVASSIVPAYGVFAWVGGLVAGAIFLQAVNYFQTCGKRDALYLKAMVVVITAIQIVSACFEIIGHTRQTELVLRGTIDPNVLVPWTNSVTTFCAVTSGLICQSYFARLIWRMTRASPKYHRYSLPWLLVFLVLALGAAGSGFTAVAMLASVRQRFWDPNTYMVMLAGVPAKSYMGWLALTAALDLTLSAVLVVRIVKDIRRDGFATTNSLLTSLAISTLETFTLTAVLATADIVPHALMGFRTYTDSSKLLAACYMMTILIQRAYAASLIFTLKRHSELRDSRHGPQSNTKSFSYASGPSDKAGAGSPKRFKLPVFRGAGSGGTDVEMTVSKSSSTRSMQNEKRSFGVVVETTKDVTVDQASETDWQEQKHPDSPKSPRRPVPVWTSDWDSQTV